MSNALDKELQNLVNNVNKQFKNEVGGNTAEFGGSDVEHKYTPTGILSLDLMLGGGFIQGGVLTLVGEESSGKSTIGYIALGQAQKEGRQAIIIQSEGKSLTKSYASGLGLDYDKCIIINNKNLSDVFSTIRYLLGSGKLNNSTILWDSHSACYASAMLDKESDAALMGLEARVTTSGIKIVDAMCDATNSTLIVISQARSTMDQYNPITTTGGRALRHASKQTIHVAGTSAIKDGKNRIGKLTWCKLIKSKVDGKAFSKTEFDLYYGMGVDVKKDLIMVAIDLGIVEQKGAWFNIELPQINLSEKAQGINGVMNLMEKDDRIFGAIKEAVYSIV